MKRMWIVMTGAVLVLFLSLPVFAAEQFDWGSGESGTEYWTPPESAEPESAGLSRAEVDMIIEGQRYYRLHKVGKGENLHLLAAYYYGDARAWRKIYFDNRDKIRNPNIIREGMILKIQVSKDWRPRFPLEAFMEIERKRQSMVERPQQERPRIIREAPELIVPVITPEAVEEEEAEEEAAPAPGAETTEEAPPPGAPAGQPQGEEGQGQ